MTASQANGGGRTAYGSVTVAVAATTMPPGTGDVLGCGPCAGGVALPPNWLQPTACAGGGGPRG